MDAICSGCVTDPYLAQLIEKDGKSISCSCCHQRSRPAFGPDEFASAIADAIEANFEVYCDLYSGYYGLELSEVVEMVLGEQTGIENEIAEALTVAAGKSYFSGDEPFFDESHSFQRKGLSYHGVIGPWEQIIDGLKHDQRFFKAQFALSSDRLIS